MSSDEKPPMRGISFNLKQQLGASRTPPPAPPKPLDLDSAIHDAQQMIANAQFSETEAPCRKILDVDPNYVRAWHLLGFHALAKGQPAEALALLGKLQR